MDALHLSAELPPMPIYVTNVLEPVEKETTADSPPETFAAVSQELVRLRKELAVETEKRTVVEATLRETEEWFRQLTMNVGKFCWISDPGQKQPIYISPGYERVWSASCERPYVSAQEWLSALNLNDLNPLSGNRLNQFGSEKAGADYQVADANGSRRWIRNRIFPIYDGAGKIVRLLGVAEDITEARQLQEALLRSESRTKALLNVLPDWMARIHKDGTLMEILGHKDLEHLPRPHRLIGKKIADLLPPQIASQAMNALAEILRSTRKRVYSCQYLLASQIRDFEAHAAVSGTDEILALIRDVTDRNRGRKELQEAVKK